MKPKGSTPDPLSIDLLIDWLEPSDDYLTTHLNIREKRIHAEAGQWVFENTKFKEWRNRPGSQLWLYGKVGSGKTILCSSMIEALRTQFSDQSSTSEGFILFYYFAFNKSNDQNLGAFLSSIIYQFCALESIPTQLQNLYMKYKRAAPGRRKIPIPGSLELSKVFFEICRSSSNHGFLLLDALDEIPHGQQRKDFLELLRMLTGHETAQVQVPSSLRTKSTLSILVTSQSQPDFGNAFLWDLGWVNLGLGRSRVDEDIARFVQYELSTTIKFSELSPDNEMEIREYLVANADGVFQWVDLILQILQIPRVLRPSQIKEILKSLPKGLEETYDRLLERIDDEDVPEVGLALKWLSLAKRPLYIEEVVEASILDVDKSVILDADRRMTAAQLLSCLTGLVTIEPPLAVGLTPQPGKHILALAHSSVREYLIMKNTDQPPRNVFQFNKETTDEFIAKCCVEYFGHCAFVSWRQYPLARYSNRFWNQHAAHNPQLSMYLDRRVNEIVAPVLHPEVDSKGRLLGNVPEYAVDDFANVTYDLIPRPLELVEDAVLSSTGRKYIFEPLVDPGSFRLLVLLPSGYETDPLQCILRHVSLQEVPQYIALSYVWGDHSKPGLVIVNGMNYHVPFNLETALRHLRAQSRGAPRAYWVDTICINQQNFDEKNHQVPMMQSIFSNASKVVAWLGASSASSEHAMSYLAKFQDIPPSAESARNLLTAMSGDTWSAIQELLQRPWFYKAWIVREMAVGRDVEVTCGRQSISWSVFELIELAYATHGYDIYSETSNLWQAHARSQDVNSREELSHSPELVQSSQFVLASGVLTMMLAIRRRHKEGQLFNFFELLIATRFYQITFPSDRIYAFFEMFKSQEAADEPPRPTIDYALSHEQICIHWSSYCLLTSRNLDFLSCVDSSQESNSRTFPSWAFDARRKLVQSLDQGEWFRPCDTEPPRLYNATSSSIARPIFADCPGLTLILSGVEVGRVNELGEPSPDAIRNLTPDAFWRTVLADQERLSFGYPQRLEEYRLKQENVHLLLAQTHTDPLYLRMTFFVSSEGLIGLCPRHTEPGDHIVLLRGGRLPFIIRELDYRERHYRLVGEAYVHGIMDGEYWNEAQNGMVGETEFRLV